jgi:hypothetical protein
MMPAVVTTPLDALERAGDPGDTYSWVDGQPDYVERFGLSAAHVPALIELVRRWSSEDRLPEGDACWASVHAWRALAQLRACEAVEPMLNMLAALNELGDDWTVEEFPSVFGLIGASAAGPLSAYLANPQNGENPRITTARGLCEIGLKHADSRSAVVEILRRELARGGENSPVLNGFVVAYLIKLGAREAADTIERAFADGRVDPFITGDWNRVRRDLGITDKGITEKGATEKANGRPTTTVDQPHIDPTSPKHHTAPTHSETTKPQRAGQRRNGRR